MKTGRSSPNILNNLFPVWLHCPGITSNHRGQYIQPIHSIKTQSKLLDLLSLISYLLHLSSIYRKCRRFWPIIKVLQDPIKHRARKIFELHLAHWASNSQILLAPGTSPLAQVFKLINNSWTQKRKSNYGRVLM